jgi:NAD(P)-dependent dehydrogenase (short-subunit alcohol dehydrogenase family)
MAQVWLVTGSSRGLGHAIVEAGLAAGNKVLATARDIKSLADLSERYGVQVKLFAMDVTDEAAAANAVMAAVDVFGSLDVVINNAGYGNLSSVEDTPLSEFRAQIETNLFGTIIVTKAALRYFREKKAGQFIQFSSVGGRIGPPGRGPYSAAKWGVEGFSEVLSREVAPLGIKVTIVEPVAFAQTSRAVPPNLAKVILNTIRRLERPQDFSGTTTASSLVTPKRQPRRSSS